MNLKLIKSKGWCKFSTNKVVVGGEVGLSNSIKIEDLSELVVETVRSTVRNIGYEQKGLLER